MSKSLSKRLKIQRQDDLKGKDMSTKQEKWMQNPILLSEEEAKAMERLILWAQGHPKEALSADIALMAQWIKKRDELIQVFVECPCDGAPNCARCGATKTLSVVSTRLRDEQDLKMAKRMLSAVMDSTEEDADVKSQTYSALIKDYTSRVKQAPF